MALWVSVHTSLAEGRSSVPSGSQAPRTLPPGDPMPSYTHSHTQTHTNKNRMNLLKIKTDAVTRRTLLLSGGVLA